MKTFEVYGLRFDTQTKIASIQADYFRIDAGAISFYKSHPFKADEIIGCTFVVGEFTVADTEFLISPTIDPESQKNIGVTVSMGNGPDIFANSDPSTEATPLPKRRRSKSSGILKLD